MKYGSYLLLRLGVRFDFLNDKVGTDMAEKKSQNLLLGTLVWNP
jgi:hypothetical protein